MPINLQFISFVCISSSPATIAFHYQNRYGWRESITSLLNKFVCKCTITNYFEADIVAIDFRMMLLWWYIIVIYVYYYSASYSSNQWFHVNARILSISHLCYFKRNHRYFVALYLTQSWGRDLTLSRFILYTLSIWCNLLRVDTSLNFQC